MPLTDTQRDHLARRLREERARLQRALTRYTEKSTVSEQEAAGDLSKIPFHLADVASDAINREIDAQEMSRMSRELAEIDDALNRLYRQPDRYGLDERTGEDIPFERLDVIPWARTRIDGARQSSGERRSANEDSARGP